MGARDILGRDEKALALYCMALVRDPSEQARVLEADERLRLYRDDNELTVLRQIESVFVNAEIRRRAGKFAGFGASQSLLRRVADKTGRMVYASPPTRTVITVDDRRREMAGPGDGPAVEPGAEPEPAAVDVETPTKKYSALCRELRLNRKLDLVSRLLMATTQAGLLLRAGRGGRLILDVLTPNQYHVVTDPDDQTREIAVIVRSTVKTPSGTDVDGFTLVDDEMTMRFIDCGQGMAPIVSAPVPHGVGALPFLGLRRHEYHGGYWDRTSGRDVVNAQKAGGLLVALVMKLHKAQGEKYPTLTGDVSGSAKLQAADGESPQCYPGAVNVQMLDSVTPPDHYWTSVEKLYDQVGRDYGIASLVNGTDAATVEEVAATLCERRAEMLTVFAEVEQDLFGLLRRFADIPDDARLRVDFADASYRGDRKTQLEIAEKELDLGLINPLDLIREKNPEITDNDEALEELIVNERMKARVMEFRVARNVKSQGNTGKTPEENGRLGPIARDAGQTGDGEDSPPPAEENHA